MRLGPGRASGGPGRVRGRAGGDRTHGGRASSGAGRAPVARRDALRLGGLALGGLALAGCSDGPDPSPQEEDWVLLDVADDDGAPLAVDLCAGSGALGLEAASRGAGEVVLVDSSRTAVAVCRANIRALGLRGVRAASSWSTLTL